VHYRVGVLTYTIIHIHMIINTYFISMTYENLKCYINRLLSNEPMFEVSAVLLMSEIVLEPSANELQSVIVTAAKDFITR